MKFAENVEEAIRFVAENPFACAAYQQVREKTVRKWMVKGFPVSVFFTVRDPETVVMEGVFAHRMDIPRRLKKGMK